MACDAPLAGASPCKRSRPDVEDDFSSLQSSPPAASIRSERADKRSRVAGAVRVAAECCGHELKREPESAEAQASSACNAAPAESEKGRQITAERLAEAEVEGRRALADAEEALAGVEARCLEAATLLEAEAAELEKQLGASEASLAIATARLLRHLSAERAEEEPVPDVEAELLGLRTARARACAAFQELHSGVADALARVTASEKRLEQLRKSAASWDLRCKAAS